MSDVEELFQRYKAALAEHDDAASRFAKAKDELAAAEAALRALARGVAR